MSSRQIASIAVFVLGVLAFLFSIDILQALIAMPFFADEIEGRIPVVLLAYVLPLALLLAAGLIMVIRRHQLSSWIVSRSDDDDDDHGSQAPDLPALLFCIIGLYLAISTLDTVGVLAADLIFLKAQSPEMNGLAIVYWKNVGRYCGTITQLILGVYLCFHSRNLGRRWVSQQARPEKIADARQSLLTCPQCNTPFDPDDYDAGLEKKLCSRCRAELPDSAFSGS